VVKRLEVAGKLDGLEKLEGVVPDDIPLLPVVPDPLRLAARQGSLVPFIGAGVSQLAGCPGWEGFADGALQYFVGRGKLKHGEFEQLRALQARVKLSIARDLERKHGLSIDFASLLQASSSTVRKTGERVYESLSKLASTFITTNYDDWLDIPVQLPQTVETAPAPVPAPPPPRRRVLSKIADFHPNNLDLGNTVFHIHGSVSEPESMILTTADYLRHYAGHSIDRGRANENQFLSFLQYLFRTKNVLFIGYGLKELEILEYVVEKAQESKPGPSDSGARIEPRHYLLEGFFSHEMQLVENLGSYFLRECNIGLMPFSRETRGWEQLVEVIDYLSQQIPVGKLLGLQERIEMEELLK